MLTLREDGLAKVARRADQPRRDRAGDGMSGFDPGSASVRTRRTTSTSPLSSPRSSQRAGASDLHLTAGFPPAIRDKGKVEPMEGFPTPDRRSRRARSSTGSSATISANASRPTTSSTSPTRSRTSPASASTATCSAARSAPPSAWCRREIPALEELGVPAVLREFTRKPRGFVLVTGPTGSGKSTTLAAMIDVINRERQDHILTIEDPIEFLHRHKRSIVNQREIGSDAPDFALGLRAALRQDPDVILVGEMRDLETISTALTAAETGHLVFATLHTQSTAQTVDRIIDVFPPEQQQQVRTQLSVALQGVVTQQLLPTADGQGRVVACEVLVPEPGGPQPDPRGEDPPDLLGDPDLRRRSACRRWTPTWCAWSAPAGSPASWPSSAPRCPEELRRLLGGAGDHGAARRLRRRRRRIRPASTAAARDAARNGGVTDGRRRPSPSRPIDLAGVPTKGEIEADSKAQVAEQLRQRGLVVLDVSEKSDADQGRGHLPALQGRADARPGGRLAPVRDPGRPRGCRCCGRSARSRSRPRTARSRRRSTAFAATSRPGTSLGPGDGAQAAGLRSPLPGDGPLRRAVGPPRGGARSDGDPHRENRHAAARGEIGADVPGAGLHRRDRRDARDRRLRRAGLRRHLRRTRRRKSRRKGRTAVDDPDHGRRLGRGHRLLVSSSSRPSRCSSTAAFAGAEPSRAGPSIDRIKLQLPFKIGDVVQKVALARWSRTFSGSVSAGVPILQAIQITGETSGNIVVEEAMEDVYDSVKRGGSIAGPIARHDDLPADGRRTWSPSARKPVSWRTC